MTPELAQELADTFCSGDPLAVTLLVRMADSSRSVEERARARTAVKNMWPAVLGEVTPDVLKPRKKTRPLWQGAQAALAELDRYSVGDTSDRTTTGLATLDERLRGGLRGGQMTLLGAPTGSGKTTLVQQIAFAAARQGRGAVLFISPEMSLESLAERAIVERSGWELWERRPSSRDTRQKTACIEAHGKAAAEIHREKLPIHVLEELEVTMADVEQAAREAGKLALVVIDYAQYVAGEGSRAVPRYLQVGEVAEKSVELAIRFDVPVLVASQVNVAKEGNKRVYTFRESQILEHKANTVLVLDVQWVEDGGMRRPDRTEIVCTKNRGFMTFRLEVRYEPALYRMSDADRSSTALAQAQQYELLPPAVPR